MDIICTKHTCNMIIGVELQEIISHNDERGYFREILRSNNSFVNEGIGQISHSLVYAGIIKAWHAHQFQTQWNYVVNGLLYVVLCDLRKNSPSYKKKMTFLIGENQKAQVYKFPSGVYHGYKCLSGPMNIIYFTSGQYNLNDELRKEHDDIEIGFDLLNPFKIK
jgi:dTDP-4-dehydrorhamnose 3,5-epimerase